MATRTHKGLGTSNGFNVSFLYSDLYLERGVNINVLV